MENITKDDSQEGPKGQQMKGKWKVSMWHRCRLTTHRCGIDVASMWIDVASDVDRCGSDVASKWHRCGIDVASIRGEG